MNNKGSVNSGCLIVILLFIAITGLSVIGYVNGWVTEAATVAQKEFGANAALKKYEWLKDASAALDKKLADLKVYEAKLKRHEDAYKDVPRYKLPRDVREQLFIWDSEVAGIAASYNDLAAEYNAQMAKFNWSFANVGELPKGATEPLPRDFKPYLIK